ncbi:ATP-binding cassette domain-containing protein [Palleronia caenipelagi]|uniref:ATP-binding cassette domain-containing protein n=1 Tax=Palleronia caenipelagi TaxID=2489174 RepID=A0A547Q5M4_9RHOB|nr:ATP-binding cassette domain-containing protein [Palleronia caenipelagi]TRD21668.1 ATP-binding cassette domain-containing protein [Palleronia caenipelagi]
MLTLDNVRLSYDDWHLSVDMEIPAGARVAILGPSGAGKSTLLAAIAGFLPLTTGRILWQGQRIDTTPPAARPVATIFQDNNLFPHLTAAQNAGLGLRPNGRLSGPEGDRVKAALARVGLDGMGDRKPGALSGGQQSRVALARAILQDRPILALDEPFSALGPALKDEMIDLVKDLATEREQTVLMITHDPGDAVRLGGSGAIVADGTVSVPVEAETLLSDPPPELRAYLGER